MPKLIIGTGSRDWKSPISIRKVLMGLLSEMDEYYHGAQRGFDQYSDFILRRLSFTNIRSFEANWNELGKYAGIERNERMLNTGLEIYGPHDILIVAMPLENSVGTYRMIDYAKEKNVKVKIYNKEGNLIDG